MSLGFTIKIERSCMPYNHPRIKDDGSVLVLQHPSNPTSSLSWTSPNEVATAVPYCKLPEELNGIALTSWTNYPATPDAWSAVDGQLAFDEPPFNKPLKKAAAAGVVVQEKDGRVWLVSPSNRFGGYATTFPKGRIEDGVSPQATAIREAFEEAGLKVKITGFLADSERTQTYTRYYLAQRIGGTPSAMGWESQAVHLVPRADLGTFLHHKNDKPLLAAILSMAPINAAYPRSITMTLGASDSALSSPHALRSKL